MEKSNSALASLTATYTDSEGEPEDRDYDEEQEGSESSVRQTIQSVPLYFMILLKLSLFFHISGSQTPI